MYQHQNIFRAAVSRPLLVYSARINQLASDLPDPDEYVCEGARVKPVWTLETLKRWNDKRIKDAKYIKNPDYQV